ncbi:glucose-6-phosphate dehydrogenase [Alicyclobacillus sp. SO9]|uniref:glucose-6-phosphate dehydrogenase n=1 Tax=Alicyclobacillus sp. SO9 TaxID=2665646 RepID=UPI0018E8E401|nr:glucose-6-phosphate dehydrogenase [Alicyclobacillus sp. SO9]QQE80224.1 glucose-6-phosphate dehydrogenase [Alicyclobacillus sp. SO9]
MSNSTQKVTEAPEHTFVLFGATGDLAQRKLFPALFSLYLGGALSSQYSVVGVARRKLDTAEFRQKVRDAIEEFSRQPVPDENTWNQFIQHFSYVALDVNNANHFCDLDDHISKVEKERGVEEQNRMFYLAMAPEFFGTVTTNLKSCNLTKNQGWKRLIIEKPFGWDYQSAEELNKELRQVFEEEEIYRIDHYLGKEMVQNIEVIRFANSIFRPVWNNQAIANVQITSSETVGVEDRASYYDKAGALRDMIQNHMLQMVMMIAMEPPSRLKNEAIRDEKVKVLRSLRRYSEIDVKDHVVRGQYQAGKLKGEQVPGYRDENNVDDDSQTETFVAARLYIDNFRWAGVPFYLRTGKRLAGKSTEIVIQFHDMPKNLYFNPNGNLNPNLLVIRVSPAEGISLLLNAKHPGQNEETVVPVKMEFSQEEDKSSPEAYERLLHDALVGDSTFFTRWDEVSLAWKFVDPIARAFNSDVGPELSFYDAGSYGPKRADELLQEDGFFWWPFHVEAPSAEAKKEPLEAAVSTKQP